MAVNGNSSTISRLGLVLTILIGVVSAVMLVLYLVLALNWRQNPFIGAMFTPLLVVDGSQSLGQDTWPGLENGLHRMDRIVAINDDVLYNPADEADSRDYAAVHARYFAAMSRLNVGDTVRVQFERPADADGNVICPPNSQPGSLADCQITYTVGELPLVDFI